MTHGKISTTLLTQTQLGMFLEWNADHSSLQYNISIDNAFAAASVDPARLAAAVRTVLEHYSVFRLHFAEQDGEFVQYPDPTWTFPVAVRAAKEADMPQIRAEFLRPHNPFVEPMARAEVVSTETATHLLIDFSHIIADGTSYRLFAAALASAYEGRALPTEGMTFVDYAALEPQLFDGEAYAAAKAEANLRFAGKAMTVPDGDVQAVRGTLVSASALIGRDEVDAFCQAKGLHPNLFFMGALARTLALFAHASESVFYTVNHGRRDARLRTSLGAYVKSVPVLAEFRSGQTLAEFLNSLKLHHVGVYPFTHFCRDLQMTPGFGYAFQDGTVDFVLRLGESVSVPTPFGCFGAGRIPVLEVLGEASSYRLFVSSSSGPYSEAWLRTFVDRVAEVARQFLAHPEARLEEIPVVSETETTELMQLGAGAVVEYDRTETFLDLFKRQVRARPSATAVVGANGTYTYGELDAASDALAGALAEKGVVHGDFVAVKLGRVKEFPLAVIAIWKAGGAYVPVDPDYPEERIAYMLADSGAKVVVDEAFVEQVEVEGRDRPHVNLARPEGLAYMIYTSGSTGKPKGVMVSHANLRAFLAWLPDELALQPGEAVAEHASFSFDASICDLYTTLARGATLHVLSADLRKDLEGLAAYLRDNRIVGATMSTQLGMELLNACDLKLRYMVLGGEKLKHVKKTSVRLFNAYGPTEFTCWSSHHIVDQQNDGDDIPIGRAVPNTLDAIVDRDGNLLPRGMTGELVLSGAQLSRGYWHRPERTAESFVTMPWTRSKVYRTGDLARWNEAGELLYCGRIDSQVKLRGFRIEMGEIEAMIAKFPGVVASAADVKNVNGLDRLIGYYVFEGQDASSSGANAQTPEQALNESLRAFLAQSLTAYMVPEAFVKLEALPKTPNGKVDRKALPLPTLTEEIVAPANARETQILALVREVLKTDEIGVTQDLARSGLSSLGAMALVAKLRKTCGLALTLAELEKSPTVRELAAKLDGPTDAPAPAKSSSRPKRATYPMTENQRGVYADWLKNPATTQYNVPSAFRFPNLDAETLAAAAARVIDAHPGFKTRFVEKDGEIVQERRDAATVEIVRETLAAEPDAAFFATRMRPFAPAGEDLVRVAVFAAPTASFLFLDAHHTIFDGFSMGVFLQDLLRTLDGNTPEGESATAFEAGLDERDYLESELVAEDETWFAQYLNGCESTALESSEPAPTDVAPGTAGRVAIRVPAGAVNRRVGELGVSASDWFLTAFMELLRRIGRKDEVQILFVSAGRAKADYAHTVGMFVRTLPVRNVRTEKTFSETVRRLHADVLSLRDRDRVSYARLAEKNGLSSEIIFAYEGGLFDLPRGATLLAPPTGTAKFPLSVTVTPGKDDFELGFEYDASRYGVREMQTLVGLFAQLSTAAVATDELREIPLLDAAGSSAALKLSYGGDLNYDETRTFVDLFKVVALTRPLARAVVDCAGALTYGELDAASSALAARLIEAGVVPGSFVGVMLPRRVSFVTTILAIQRAGAGYVPLDAEYPTDRLAYMLSDCEAKVLVTTHALFDDKGLTFAGTVLFADDAQPPAANLSPSTSHLARPQGLAYMIYTSGSTGKPKGVVVSHRALRHLVEWTRRDRAITYDSRIFEHASFSFDASVIDIFPVLAAGGELHILAEDLRKDLPGIRNYIVREGLTGGSMSTQVGMALMDAYPDLPLHDLMFGGEKLLPTAKTKVQLLNGYGPTEFCVCSSYQVVDQSAEGDIPIGRPVAGTWSLIVDRYGYLLPQGIAGELALAGPQIADGYWHRPERTAETFTPTSHLQSSTFNRIYRTGDLARYDAAGRLAYLGRLDFQVKLRGFRIEIGEIEHAASLFAGVASVAAEVRDVGGAKHLVLYYAEKDGRHDVKDDALRTHLASSLTAYMVPDYFVRVETMPMTPNGKINRRALPAPAADASAHEYVAPREGVEKTIAEAWRAILKVERVGATDDFFASGGTSLLGIKAVVAMQKAGLDVQYGDLFKHKTPRELASFLAGETQGPTCDAQHATFAADAFDYAAIDALLAKTRTDLFENFHVHSLGDVLLTGATGYLGIHVLRYLLTNTSSSVTVLLRSKGKMTPERRLNAQYVYYFGERLPVRFRDRLDFVEGDITDSTLGERLAQREISTVINCAALVKHYIADDALDRVNVKGVENLLAWCAARGARFVQTSTYSVGGFIDAAAPGRLDERRLYVGQDSDNDYIRTKFLAERAVLAAVAAGKVKAKIMRLGNLMGRESDGEFQMNIAANAFVNSLKSYRAIGAYPLDELAAPLEMSPIDRVAEAVCLLATTPDDMVVFHPYNCYPLDMGAVLGALNRRGHEIDFTSRAEFAARVDALKADPTRADDLQGILHYAQRHLEGRKSTPVANVWTTTVLYRLGFRWKPAEDRYLANFFDRLEGLATFG